MGKEIPTDEFKKLISLGEEKGFLTYDDVNDLLPSDIISSDQIDDIIMLFGEKNIDIIDTDKGEKLIVKKPTDEMAGIKEEETLGLAPLVGKTGDPVKMYLREMGLVSLLSREGEVEIAKKIEEGLKESMDAVFGVNVCIKNVVDIGVRLRNEDLRVKNVVDIGVRLRNEDLRVKNVVDNLEDEDGYVEEDLHRERLLKLIDKVTVLDKKNDILRLKLKTKGLLRRKFFTVSWMRIRSVSSSFAAKSNSASGRLTGWSPFSRAILRRSSRWRKMFKPARIRRAFP
jgi:RNA polymerase primary sigma factor